MTSSLPVLSLDNLRTLYRTGQWTPRRLVEAVRQTIASKEPSAVWIHLLCPEELEPYLAALEEPGKEDLPLYGVPFAIKDNLDLAGIPTTAACPQYSYTPERSAFVVQRLLSAGALPVGKTNLDQFATGLVGTRSPYGTPQNPYNTQYLPGGSSSGSAVSVAGGLVSFALGTDTAGSGRIPAAFNNLVGHKPTGGVLSTSGLVPACRSLDCVSIFALQAQDAAEVFEVAAHYDSADPYSVKRQTPPAFFPRDGSFRFGVPSSAQLEYFGNQEASPLFQSAVKRCEALGGEAVEIDFTPFLQAARLLYEGPWIAQRFAALEAFITQRPEALHPVTRDVLSKGQDLSAVETFRALDTLKSLQRSADEVFDSVDTILTPTSGTIYTLAEVEKDPLQLNSNLGYYTNFMNLLGYAATAFPAGFFRGGHPFGVTAFAPAHHDRSLLALAAHFQRKEKPSLEQTHPPEGWIPLVVCGAHLEGLALNWQLTSRGGRLWKKTQTAPLYDFYALPPVGTTIPARPGVVRVGEKGVSLAVEVWLLPASEFGGFVAQIPAPLGIGKVVLNDAAEYPGFLCESYATEGAKKISHLADWRKFLHTEKR